LRAICCLAFIPQILVAEHHGISNLFLDQGLKLPTLCKFL
jgi:hypothetical protein